MKRFLIVLFAWLALTAHQCGGPSNPTDISPPEPDTPLVPVITYTEEFIHELMDDLGNAPHYDIEERYCPSCPDLPHTPTPPPVTRDCDCEDQVDNEVNYVCGIILQTVNANRSMFKDAGHSGVHKAEQFKDLIAGRGEICDVR